MKALSILATVFLFTSAVPAFADSSDYQLWRWDTSNIKMSDIRFNPEFLIMSLPTETQTGANLN